jgi:hypothetical protein
MSNTDTDFIILDENPVYANQISEFMCSNKSFLSEISTAATVPKFQISLSTLSKLTTRNAFTLQ